MKSYKPIIKFFYYKICDMVEDSLSIFYKWKKLVFYLWYLRGEGVRQTEIRTSQPPEPSVDKKNQLDVTFFILYFSSNSCSKCLGQPCAQHQELTTA